jgi:hypothetical protein
MKQIEGLLLVHVLFVAHKNLAKVIMFEIVSLPRVMSYGLDGKTTSVHQFSDVYPRTIFQINLLNFSIR